MKDWVAAGRLGKWSFTRKLLGLGFIVGATSVMGQTCITCPANAQAGNAGGAGPVIYVVRNNQSEIVSPGRVGVCEELYIFSYVSYNPNGQNAQGQIITGAGFTGGTGHIIMPDGTAVNVTPGDMSTTIVGPAPCGTTTAKPMNVATYRPRPADIGTDLIFTFEYTNATFLLTNQEGQCILKNQLSLQQTVSIVPCAQFTNIVTDAGRLILSGSGGLPGGSYCVLQSSDATKSADLWVPIQTNNFDESGQFVFTNTLSAGASYFRLLLR